MLEKVTIPDDLKKLTPDELTGLADDIRSLIIDTVAKNGGHLAASLGVVELTIAVHYVFDAPRDKIIWDVGHQSYAHKILTGRKADFLKLRQYGALSGFPKREESPYDAFNTGHSSTSISAASGMAQARCLQGRHHKVIAIIGDGAMGAGMAFEALNHAGHTGKDMIVILNDNEMSISPNVGALASCLSRIISGQAYNTFRDRLRSILERIPGIGESVYRVVRQSEGFFKSLFVPGLIFEELGFVYIGPVAGHRIDHLVQGLRNIRNLKGPILFHVITKKGCGYGPAEQDPVSFHGIGPFVKETGKQAAPPARPSYTGVFGQALARAARDNSKIVAITAGMTSGTGLDTFQKEFPGRFHDVGIAEQHAVTFAAGLAAEGFRPVVAIYSTFLQRSFDQVLHDVCLQKLPVVFMLDRAGIVGEDGPTHHGLFDLSYLRMLPGLVLMAPRDENELGHMLHTALQLDGPAAIRYPRGSGEGVGLDKDFVSLTVGTAEILARGKDAALWAIGSTVYPAAEAGRMLEAEGICCQVVNSRFIKPLDAAALLASAEKTGAVVTIEENVLQGGFGSAVLECLQEHDCRARVARIGIPDVFVEHGTQPELRSRYGLDAAGICATVKKVLQARAVSGSRASELSVDTFTRLQPNPQPPASR